MIKIALRVARAGIPALLLGWTVAPPPALAAYGYSSTFQIVGVGARQVEFELAANQTNPNACPEATTFHIMSLASNCETITSSLMTAYATGKTVQLWTRGCDTDGLTLFNAESQSHLTRPQFSRRKS